MTDDHWEYVASTVVVGLMGQPMVTRGYMEIGGVRIYDDQVIVGQRGQPEISPGWMEAQSVSRAEPQP